MNYKFIGFIAAAAAMSLVSCQKQEFKPSTDGTVITVNANVEDPANISKTYVEEADGVYNINWSDSESMAAVSFTGNEANVYKSSSFTLNEDGSGIFTLKDENLSSGKETIAGVYPYDASVSNNDNSANFKVELPSTQSPVAGSYDPNAYVMIARPESLETIAAAGYVWNAYYYRAAALNRFSITGLEHGGEITSARIIFAEKTNAAGRRYFDLATTTPGEFYQNRVSSKYENIITLNYSTPLTATENKYDLWFTTWNVEVPTTSSFTVEITAGSYIYTKTFTPKKEGFILAENCLNLVDLDMTGATEGSVIEPSGQGTIADPYNVAAALKAIEESGNVNQVYAKGYITKIDQISTEYGDATYHISDDVNGINSLEIYRGYYLNAEKFTSEEQIKTGDEVIVFGNLTKFGTIYEFNTGSYIYSLNGTVSTPSLEVTNNSQTVSADAKSVSFKYNARVIASVNAEIANDENGIISAVAIDEASSTVNVTLNPNTEEVEKTATITLSAEGVVPVTLTIVQKGYIATVTTITDILTADAFNAGSSYQNVSLTAESGAEYAGNMMMKSKSTAIQIRGEKGSGIITKVSDGKVSKIEVVWNSETYDGRSLDIYGSNEPYTGTDASELYTTSTQGELLGSIVYGESTELTISGDYQYIGLRSKKSAMYLEEIRITWEK